MTSAGSVSLDAVGRLAKEPLLLLLWYFDSLELLDVLNTSVAKPLLDPPFFFRPPFLTVPVLSFAAGLLNADPADELDDGPSSFVGLSWILTDFALCVRGTPKRCCRRLDEDTLFKLDLLTFEEEVARGTCDAARLSPPSL